VADDTADRSVSAAAAEVNPPPESLRTATFVVREAVALIFVVIWLALFAGELLTGAYVLPFWFHMTAVGVLGYALGLNLGALTALWSPPKRAVAKGLLRAAAGD
jgi:hypothetical protein